MIASPPPRPGAKAPGDADEAMRPGREPEVPEFWPDVAETAAAAARPERMCDVTRDEPYCFLSALRARSLLSFFHRTEPCDQINDKFVMVSFLLTTKIDVLQAARHGQQFVGVCALHTAGRPMQLYKRQWNAVLPVLCVLCMVKILKFQYVA